VNDDFRPLSDGTAGGRCLVELRVAAVFVVAWVRTNALAAGGLIVWLVRGCCAFTVGWDIRTKATTRLERFR
jgi:hypothetical protein